MNVKDVCILEASLATISQIMGTLSWRNNRFKFNALGKSLISLGESVEYALDQQRRKYINM
jgi:hypothetical protein